MKKISLLPLVAAAAVVSAPAFAQEEAAGGADVRLSAGYSSWSASDGDLGTFGGRGTVFFNNYFGVEGELNFAAGEEDFGGIETKIKNQFGGFVVVRAPTASTFEPYARLGYSSATVEASAFGTSADIDLKGIAYGVGANIFFGDKFGVRGDFSQYDGGDDFDGEADVWTISAVLKF